MRKFLEVGDYPETMLPVRGRGSANRSRKAARGRGSLPKGHVAKMIEFIKFSAFK